MFTQMIEVGDMNTFMPTTVVFPEKAPDGGELQKRWKPYSTCQKGSRRGKFSVQGVCVCVALSLDFTYFSEGTISHVF